MSMRNVALLLLMLPLATVNLPGQTQSLGVFWDEKPSCGVSNLPISRSEIKCSRKSTDDLEFRTIKHNGVTISSAFIVRGEVVKAIIRVTNDQTRYITVDVNAWRASSFTTYDAFLAAEKPVRMSLASVPIRTFSRPPNVMVREAPDRSVSGNPTNAPMTDIGKTTSATVAGTTMRQDEPILPSKKPAFFDSVDGENESAMHWKTIPAMKKFSGAVSFATVKDATFRLVALDVNATVYIFTIRNPAK